METTGNEGRHEKGEVEQNWLDSFLLRVMPDLTTMRRFIAMNLGGLIVLGTAGLILINHVSANTSNIGRSNAKLNDALCAQLVYLNQPRLRDDKQTVNLVLTLVPLIDRCGFDEQNPPEHPRIPGSDSGP